MANSIYVEKLIDKNVGPLTDVRIDFPFAENGNPKPVIFVGENGSGKSTVLSNIVDAFFEMAGQVFTNSNPSDTPLGYQFFKAISPAEIHNGASYLFSFISFAAEKCPKYVFKSGNISVGEFRKSIEDESIPFSWEDGENRKLLLADKATITSIWKNNVLCYFGPGRYEKPSWMGNKYYHTEDHLHPAVTTNFDGVLRNPIIVQDVTSQNLQWLLDVITDSRADVTNNVLPMRLNPSSASGNEYMMMLDNANVNDLLLLKKSRNSLEAILGEILGEEICFQLNYRNSGGSRFRIVKKRDSSTVCPTLDSLSTGQIALFNMFATIVRYADNNDINQSFRLNEITGIVVIDEVELHLHSKLQKEVLPRLINLFPKIQFIITSHSPLFLLGMRDTFGEDGFCVYEMPKAELIGVERFSEFLRAYDYIKETEQFHAEIKRIADSLPAGNKPLIITEGPTDWKHLKAAFESLRFGGLHKDLFESLDFEFYEYESTGSSEEAEYKVNMSNSDLYKICEAVAKLPRSRKHIFIADRDDRQFIAKFSHDNGAFKPWGNNVYSFVLPVPQHRAATPEICIEHYYTDDEIKTEWIDPISGTVRRLYIGNEFDARGAACNTNMLCENKSKCGSTSIAIIDGSSGDRVTCFDESNGPNYALPKSKFAKFILEKQSPFDSFNFESFVGVFEVIRDIIADNQEGTNV